MDFIEQDLLLHRVMLFFRFIGLKND